MTIQHSSPSPRGLQALELKQQGKTLAEIADYYHVSTERARQILLRAEMEEEAHRKAASLKERCASLLQRPEVPADVLGMTIDYLNLSARASNCLKFVRINTIGDLVCKTSHQLSGIKNMGKKTLDEIEAALDEVGLSLSDIPIRFNNRRLPAVSARMRMALEKRGWRETVDGVWIHEDGEHLNWEEAATVELNSDRELRA
jgi:DNA-binding CsgD family transcriptional regulator